MKGDLLQTHIRTYETRKLVRRNLAKTFEAGNLRIRSQLTNSSLTLFFTIAVTGDEIALLIRFGICFGNRFLILDLCTTVADSEKRCLQDIHVTLLNQFGEELQEEGNDEQADMHTVDIGISSHNHLVIT